MFTGLIEETGTVLAIRDFDGGRAYDIQAGQVMQDLKIDDSIAVNGCCQTVIAIDADCFTVQAIRETLEKTNFLDMQVGTTVNLERAMQAHTRLGGHMVQGHINGTGTVAELSQRGENWYVGICLPAELYQYCIREGSIAIDGISLTLADLKADVVYLSIIPHTWKVTAISQYQLGQRVNIEVDMFAKMVHQFLGQYMEQHLPRLIQQFQETGKQT